MFTDPINILLPFFLCSPFSAQFHYYSRCMWVWSLL